MNHVQTFMKCFSTFLCLLSLVLFPSLPAAEASEMHADLIADLTSDSFQTREAATHELWALGDSAIPSLRIASRSEDPEMALRAADVLEKVELRITPDTPAIILDLIQKYRESAQNRKVNYLNELKRRKAYFQVLKLYSLESPENRATMEPNLRGVALSGARDAIVKGDLETAVLLLRMSADDENVIALASLYQTMGLLEDGKDLPEPPSNVPTDLWKIAILRVKGDLAGAIRISTESKRVQLQAGLKVLAGDPTDWLQENGFGNRDKQAQEAYITAALKRWRGGELRAVDIDPLIKALKSDDLDESNQAVSSLGALGILPAAEKFQAERNPLIGFEYYLSQERVGEALEIIGLDPVTPDYVSWVAERFEKVLKAAGEDEDGDSPDKLSELVTIAAFLERRGLDEELSKAFSGPLQKYAEKDENHFLDFLRLLARGKDGAPQFAMLQGIKWAGDKDPRWDEIYAVLLGEEDGVEDWREWLLEMEPEVDRLERLKGMMALFGLGQDPDRLRAQWISKAWNSVESGDEKLKDMYVKRILNLSVRHEDLANALKAYDALKPSVPWTSIDKFLTAAGRWKQAAEILESAVKSKGDSSPELHAYLAAHLRRAGREKEAAEHDAWAEKLALGSARSCRLIGAYYAYGQDDARAAKWYQRSAFLSEPSDSGFAAFLETYADSRKEAGDWSIAASCYEALLQIYSSRDYIDGTFLAVYKSRLNADLTRALALLPTEKERAIALLDGTHRNFVSDGILADDFFPLVRKAGLTEELKGWFEESWSKVSAAITEYPGSDTTRNTAAWFASRAVLRVEEGKAHLETALAKSPEQPAYLDTMAETSFALGDRKSAKKWSSLAINFSPFDDVIRSQYRRFANAKMPR